MTRSIPAHKQTNHSKQPGQVSFDRMPFLKHSTAEPGLALESGEFIPAKELTLNDYIAKKQDEPRRITFVEWFTNQYGNPDDEVYDWSLKAWNAALKQGKL